MLQAAGLAPAASLPSNTDWLPLGLRNKQPHWNDSERTSQHCCQSCDLQPARSRQELSVSPWRLLLLLLACAPEALAARRQNSNFTYAAYIELPLFNADLRCHCLNFHGRVKEASVKNFQLVRFQLETKPPRHICNSDLEQSHSPIRTPDNGVSHIGVVAAPARRL